MAVGTLNPYRTPGVVEPVPVHPCTDCRRGIINVGRLVMVGGVYGAGNEVWVYECRVCGRRWDRRR